MTVNPDLTPIKSNELLYLQIWWEWECQGVGDVFSRLYSPTDEAFTIIP
jgi:hypothetical protein